MRDSFVFYRNFYETIKELPKRQFTIMLDAIINYGLYKTLPDKLPPALLALFNTMKYAIDKAQKRYDSSVENGRLGGAPKGNKNAEKNLKNNLETTQNNQKQPNSTKNNLNDKCEVISDNDKCESDNDNVGCFFTPTLNEILSYSKELGKGDEKYCTRFFENYESKGWKDITDWKAKFRYWLSQDEDKSKEEDTGYQVGNTRGLPKA